MSNANAVIKAYVKGKFNMSKSDLEVAIVLLQRQIQLSDKENECNKTTLEGYKKALSEKS